MLEDFLGTWRIDETDNHAAAPFGRFINIARWRENPELGVAVWSDSDQVEVEVGLLRPEGDALVTAEPAYGEFDVTILRLLPGRLQFDAVQIRGDLEDPPSLAGTWGAEDVGGGAGTT